MADSKQPRVQYVIWERSPDAEGALLIKDMIVRDVDVAQRQRTRRQLMRQLGQLVDQWLADPDVARIQLELPHPVTGEPG